MEIERITKLPYEIHSFSSFSSSYLPENIRDNCPTNQISRWSSDTNVPTQFITLRLHKPAIVKRILFGKYEKSHVCNLKKFKVYGGLLENNLFQIFEGGLKNDNVPETFDLKHKMYIEDEGVERDIPILYVQIVPLLSFGPSFNFSIWYVELQGIDSEVYVIDMMKNFNDQREKLAIRLILKHLRDKGFMRAFKALEIEAKISLEDNQITELFHSLVEMGDFYKAEKIMENFIENREYIDEYISSQKYTAKYNEIKTDNEKDYAKPCNRTDAGYAFDNDNSIVYMLGGCSEEGDDLNDFWQYDLKSNRWTQIHEKCSISPRAGHKMVFDNVSKQIFFIGRRVSKNLNSNDNCKFEKNDFYLYDIQTKGFFLICEDVRTMNGPPLLCDHQIVLNSKDRTIYIFGGKIVNKSDESNETFSGFYSYHISTNTWNLICLDVGHPSAANPEMNSIKSRTSHGMIYDDIRRKIYIIGGQRGKETCNDIMQFDIDSGTFNTIQTTNTSHVASPSTSSSTAIPSDSINLEKLSGLCFATMNSNKNEIYVLMKDNLCLYVLATNEFSMIHKTRSQTSNSTMATSKDLSPIEESCTYSDTYFFVSSNGMLFLFKNDSTVYSIDLQKPSTESVMNYCRYLIRRQQYEELTQTNAINALTFLRNNLSETIDKNDADQVHEFHKLTSLLFCNKLPYSNNANSDNDNKNQQDDEIRGQNKIRSQRSILFNKLTSILPRGKCQPQQNILNFINV